MWKKVKNFWKEAPRKYPNAPLYIAGAAIVLRKKDFHKYR